MKFEQVPPKIESSLPVIAKTGKIEFGFNNVVWTISHRPRQIKMLIVCRNIPKDRLDRLVQLASAKKIKIYRTTKSNIELGEAIGRSHSVTTLAILDFGAITAEEE